MCWITGQLRSLWLRLRLVNRSRHYTARYYFHHRRRETMHREADPKLYRSPRHSLDSVDLRSADSNRLSGLLREVEPYNAFLRSVYRITRAVSRASEPYVVLPRHLSQSALGDRNPTATQELELLAEVLLWAYDSKIPLWPPLMSNANYTDISSFMAAIPSGKPTNIPVDETATAICYRLTLPQPKPPPISYDSDFRSLVLQLDNVFSSKLLETLKKLPGQPVEVTTVHSTSQQNGSKIVVVQEPSEFPLRLPSLLPALPPFSTHREWALVLSSYQGWSETLEIWEDVVHAMVS